MTKSYRVSYTDHSGLQHATISIGQHVNSVLKYVAASKHASIKAKVGKSNFIVTVGSKAVIQFDLSGFVSEVLVFESQREQERFRDELKFKEANLEISLHVLERLKDRYDYAKGYSIEGLLRTASRAVRKSRLAFKTQTGKSIRFYGKHIFVIADNRVVTLLAPRPEYYIYEEAYKRSPIPLPDALVSKHISEKADAIFLRFK